MSKNNLLPKSKKIVVLIIIAVILLIFLAIYLLFGTKIYKSIAQTFNLVSFSYTAVHKYPASMHVLDTGNSDSILLCCDDEYILIDGAEYNNANYIINYLEDADIHALKAIINTHPDRDHLGSLSTIIDKFSVKSIYFTSFYDNEVPNTIEYNELIKAVATKKIEHSTLKQGQMLDLGSAKIEVLAPIFHHDNINNNSLVLKFSYKNTDFTLMADAELEEEADILSFYEKDKLKTDVIKIGHHGSKTSTSDDLLKALDPKIAVISVGTARSSVPNSEVLHKLYDNNIDVMMTKNLGTIAIMSDGKNIYTDFSKAHENGS